MANHVFSRNVSKNREVLAQREAFMLWLAWRGSDDYLIRHFGDVDGQERSWQLCHQRTILTLMMGSQSREEFRPLNDEFSEPILASIINQVDEYCKKVKDIPKSDDSTLADPEIVLENVSEPFSEKRKAEILSSMSMIQEGWTLNIRWPMRNFRVLSPRFIELSRWRLVMQNNPKLCVKDQILDPSVLATKGYLQFVRRKDRLESQRKRRLGILRWLSTQRD